MTFGAPDVSFCGMKVVPWVDIITVVYAVPCFIFPDTCIPCGLPVLAIWDLHHGAANNLTPSLPCTFKLYPWAALGQDRVCVCCCKVSWSFLNYYYQHHTSYFGFCSG